MPENKRDVARRLILDFLDEAIREIDGIERDMLAHADWPTDVDNALIEARDRLRAARGFARG